LAGQIARFQNSRQTLLKVEPESKVAAAAVAVYRDLDEKLRSFIRVMRDFLSEWALHYELRHGSLTEGFILNRTLG